MKRVIFGGKGAMTYPNVGLGQAPGTVMYKVGSPGGGAGQQQQGWDSGTAMSAPAFKTPIAAAFHHQQADSPATATAAAAWNIITLSMYIRAQSSLPQESALYSATSNFASDASSDGDTKFSSSPYSLYCGLDRSSSGGSTDLDARSGSDSDDSKEQQPRKVLDNRSSQNSLLRGISSGDSSSSDEGKSEVSHLRGQRQWEANARLADESYGARPDASSRLHAAGIARGGSGSVIHMGGPELSSSSSSSIGCCDDDSSCSSDGTSNDCCWGGEMEVESAPHDGPLHHMGALEDSLPIKKGLSRFWNGKAKSFRSLADVSSIEQLAKPENPYAKRRRMATLSQRHRSFPPLSRTSTRGISKRPTATSGGRSGLAIAVAMGSELEEATPKHHNPSAAAATTSRTPFFSGRSLSVPDLAKGS